MIALYFFVGLLSAIGFMYEMNSDRFFRSLIAGVVVGLFRPVMIGVLVASCMRVQKTLVEYDEMIDELTTEIGHLLENERD